MMVSDEKFAIQLRLNTVFTIINTDMPVPVVSNVVVGTVYSYTLHILEV